VRQWPWRWLAAALWCLAPSVVEAQARGAPRPESPRRPTAAAPASQRAAGDTTRRAPSDTAKAEKQLIAWIPNDSMMVELLKRQGTPGGALSRPTTIGFVADVAHDDAFDVGHRARRAWSATATTAGGAPHRLQRQSTKMMMARGDTITMRDPARGEDVIRLALDDVTIWSAARDAREDLSTVANSGADWRVSAHRATFASDTASERTTLYGRDGIITSCLDSLPHYHFQARELKRVSNSVIVARPAVLLRAGRPGDVASVHLPGHPHGAALRRCITPRLGISEVVRNSPTYRRTDRRPRLLLRHQRLRGRHGAHRLALAAHGRRTGILAGCAPTWSSA
jgi:hypothetical protein